MRSENSFHLVTEVITKKYHQPENGGFVMVNSKAIEKLENDLPENSQYIFARHIADLGLTFVPEIDFEF